MPGIIYVSIWLQLTLWDETDRIIKVRMIPFQYIFLNHPDNPSNWVDIQNGNRMCILYWFLFCSRDWVTA